ncbi:MAG: 5-oxoprolinase [Pirellulaceae bacterium]|nr:MAG: 5-oxoprolinase [Pirellulaceae bacterium]
MKRWELWVDVGGTFTDCVARSPDGSLRRVKVLSTAHTPGLAKLQDGLHLVDERRREPAGFWNGYTIRLIVPESGLSLVRQVAASEPGRLELSEPIVGAGTWRYEIISEEEAPVLAARLVLGIGRREPLPPMVMRLGTTRGTNALLTRQGAPTALVTTRGFGDVLEIGYQDRPRLFELSIRKPPPLYRRVAELDERIDAGGNILQPLDDHQVEQVLDELLSEGIRSVAVALLHAWINPIHEQRVAELARRRTFDTVSVSSELAPLIKIVSRAETTVLNAYLNPVLQDYLARIVRALGPQSDLLVMTSAGGLERADRFQAKDSILSGPAGGVVGCARWSQSAGHRHVIGFDMGGTSTDVSRYDGRLELEYETRKAGVRVMAPMLAIETVAAGGGSICSFDGVKLTVGPSSAAADPGPACYGRGGPLTVTDLNLFLGRIPAERFPFALDTAAVHRRLAELVDTVRRQTGKHYTFEELADGLLWIANTQMAQAIRSVSIARGYDPRQYLLIAFGGAAGQHACHVAEQLGIEQVVFHPDAGLLSALGTGMADWTRHAARGIYRHYDQVERELDGLFDELVAELQASWRADGVPHEKLVVRRLLDMRFAGLETALTVEASPERSPADNYRQQFRQLYGYLPDDRPIEVTAVRVEASLASEYRLPATGPPPQSYRKSASRFQKSFFAGQWWNAALWDRNELVPGDVLDGPAVISEPYATVVLPPGWTASVYQAGELVAEHRSPRNTKAETSRLEVAEPDPIALEVFHQQFARIAEQMGIVLRQTAISVNVKERLDFSCAVFDRRGHLVANAPHIPVHLGAMGSTVRALCQSHPDMQPGDVFVTNDPYRGGSHLPDVTVVTPVFVEDDPQPAFFTASRAHHAEIGGVTPGSMPPASRSLAEEGVLIRDFQLARGGRYDWQGLRQLLASAAYPSRDPDTNVADIAAQVAANHHGAQLLKQLAAQFGHAIVQRYMQYIQQAAERKMRSALERFGDGEYRFTDYLDDGTPIAASIRVENGRIRFDFSGTGPVLPGNLNANPAIVTAAVIYVLRCLLNEEVPLNEGMLAPVGIHLPECLLNPPAQGDPASLPAVAGGNVETSQRVVDVLLGALKLAAASQGTMNNLSFGDATFGYYETICGGEGATPAGPGASAVHTHMTNTRLTDVEVLERRYPVRLREFSIRRGSGGTGRNAGGDGVIRCLEFLRPLCVSILSQRRSVYAPFGLEGGRPGAPGENLLIRADGRCEKLPGIVQFQVAPGDILRIATPGGGGWGASNDSR